MFAKNSLSAAFILSVLTTFNLLPETESAPLANDQYPIVYRRYIQHRPIALHPTDKFVEDVYEIFSTKAKPSSYIGMTDDEMDRFIFCDFNRHLEECQKYWEARSSRIHPSHKPLTTTPSSDIFSTKAKPTSYIGMTDDEMDRFIFCDFNRHLEECQKYWEARNAKIYPSRKPPTTTAKSTTSTIASSSTTSTTTTTELNPIPHLVDNDDETVIGNRDEVYDAYGEYGGNEFNVEENGEAGNDVDEYNEEY